MAFSSLALAACGDGASERTAPAPDEPAAAGPEAGAAMQPEGRGGARVPAGVTTAPDVIALGPGRPVVVPDTTPDTNWLERVSQLAYDPGTGRLLVLNQGSSGAVEFTRDGRLHHRFGAGAGRGPGELVSAERFALNDDVVVIHDRRNAKLLFFRRADGAHQRDVRLPRGYSDLTLAPDGARVFLVPGAPGHALDILDLASGEFEPVGSLLDLPLFCDRGDCTPRREYCTGCRVQAVGDSVVVVLNVDLAALVTFDARGSVLARLAFNEANPLLRHWQEQDRPFLERARARNPRNAVEIKSYFMDVAAAVDGRVAVPVIPSRPEWQRRGNELWLVEPLTGRYARYRYPERVVGFLGVFTGGEVVGFHPQSGGFYRFGVPGGG